MRNDDNGIDILRRFQSSVYRGIVCKTHRGLDQTSVLLRFTASAEVTIKTCAGYWPLSLCCVFCSFYGSQCHWPCSGQNLFRTNQLLLFLQV